ncbi:SCO2524 family protein [Micromonospora sp. CPCC 206060]|uniref:SCO2524 family protein n=1 Tax=Micromonospora sp. CPCC 206060 TaxID=3122406 RepID=UPI002FEF9875
MRIQPRQQLLEIWAATVRASWRDDQWHWGGRDGSNSISDAEQLLCLLLPATRVPTFKIDNPNESASEMIRVLRPLGNATQIPRVLIRVLTEYFTKYTDESGTPVFSGGSYFEVHHEGGPPTSDQKRLDIVDSFAMSVTLSLATVGFLKVFRKTVTRSETHQEIDRLEQFASIRLSAAMVGLLRSFSVYPFDADSPEGQALIRTVNQGHLPERQVVAQLRSALEQTMASFREITIGSGQVLELDPADRLFECGWSWGVVKDAPAIKTEEPVGEQPKGLAQDAPYLYFTVIALDAIEDLFSERTRILGLLNEEQQRLARALQLRWELTRTYWAKVATFGEGPRWPLEDIPWRTTDQESSDYFTLLVTSLAVKGLVNDRGSDAELSRVGAVLTELANRARITRRTYEHDPALALHSPGVRFHLVGSDLLGGSQLSWVVSDFSALLLQRAAVIAKLLSDARHRDEVLDLADRTWDHLLLRRLAEGPGRSLWDQPDRVFNRVPLHYAEPSWYHTERVVHGLVNSAEILAHPPLRSERLAAMARDLLSEAEHLYDMELLSGTAEANPRLRESMYNIRVNLRRGREILQDKPGASMALALDVLLTLDEFEAARRDVTEAG